MLERREYNKMAESLRDRVQQDGMVGFLQRFYSLNMINEMICEDSEVRDEWSRVMKSELTDMYSSLDSKYTSENVPVLTIALLESCFPEFLNGEHNSTCEQRQAAATLISTSKHYQDASSLLKGEIMSSLVEDKSIRRSAEVPVIGDLSKGVIYTYRRPIEQSR